MKEFLELTPKEALGTFVRYESMTSKQEKAYEKLESIIKEHTNQKDIIETMVSGIENLISRCSSQIITGVIPTVINVENYARNDDFSTFIAELRIILKGDN
jgi:hypothetical protein